MSLANSSRSAVVQPVLLVLFPIPLRSLVPRKSLVHGLSRVIASLATNVPLRISSLVRTCPWIGRTKKLHNRLQQPQPPLPEETTKREEKRGGKSVMDQPANLTTHLDGIIPYLAGVQRPPLDFYHPTLRLQPPAAHL